RCRAAALPRVVLSCGYVRERGFDAAHTFAQQSRGNEEIEMSKSEREADHPWKPVDALELDAITAGSTSTPVHDTPLAFHSTELWSRNGIAVLPCAPGPLEYGASVTTVYRAALDHVLGLPETSGSHQGEASPIDYGPTGPTQRDADLAALNHVLGLL